MQGLRVQPSQRATQLLNDDRATSRGRPVQRVSEAVACRVGCCRSSARVCVAPQQQCASPGLQLHSSSAHSGALERTLARVDRF